MQYSKDFIARYIAAACLTKVKNLEDLIAVLQDNDEQLFRLLDSLTLDVDNIKRIIRLIQAQLNDISLLSLTLAEYNALAIHDTKTLYIVTDTSDDSVSLYWGDTLIQGGGGGSGVQLSALTLAEYTALTPKDPMTLYIVTDTTDDSVSLYWGDTPIQGSGGGGSEYEERIEALEYQVTGIIGMTQNPKVNLRWYTRAQYEAISHDNNTLYVVQNLDSTMQVYVGDTLLNSNGGGVGMLIMVLGVTVPILTALSLTLPMVVGVGQFTEVGGE